MSFFDATIKISRHSPVWRQMFCVPYALLRRLARMTLASVFSQNAAPPLKTFQIQLTLTTDCEVARLNQEYRHRHGPTNVLSFHQFDSLSHIQEEASQKDIPLICLGDLVLSDFTVFNEAYQYQRSLDHYFAHLFVHGMLHLLGYDHETPQEASVMEALETHILAQHGIEDPYHI